jgi:myo-inositol-1(or 4)-monophosphatase
MADPAELLDLARTAAREAGDLLLRGLGKVRTDVRTKSSLTDMVSEMDGAAEALIVDRLLGSRPGDGMVGEEGTAVTSTSGTTWIVDPLDGTTNYLYGLPGFNVSIAAEQDGIVVAGVVLDVVRDELFTAAAGRGAALDDVPIAVSAADALPTALVATGFAYDADRRRRQAQVLVEVIPLVRDIRRFGAAAIDLCNVACGRVDAYYERGLSPWDLAAGVLIATEAGAVVRSLDERPVREGSLMAAAPGIADELHSLLTSAGAADA